MAGGRSLLFLVGMLVLLCQPVHGSILDEIIDDVIGPDESKNSTKTKPPAKPTDDDGNTDGTDDDGTDDDGTDDDGKKDDDGNEEDNEDEDREEEGDENDDEDDDEAKAEAAAEAKRKEIIQKAKENIIDLESIESLTKEKEDALKIMMDEVQDLINEEENSDNKE